MKIDVNIFHDTHNRIQKYIQKANIVNNALYQKNFQANWWELQNQKLKIINEKYAKRLTI